MDIKIGVIVIGSLLWDLTDERKKWQAELSLEEKIRVKMPIRYGRLSSESRKNTYSMVFSNEINNEKMTGFAFVIPYKRHIQSNEEFIKQMKLISKAEGISDNRICKSWGTVCISINPFIDPLKKDEISLAWNNLVKSTKENLTTSQREPAIEKFGEMSERKSIDENWNLTIDIDDPYKNELKQFDCLIATSNAVRLNEQNENIYPNAKQIAKAIRENEYYTYFLNNRKNGISTFQDKKIAKILKRKYRISLKKKHAEEIKNQNLNSNN